MEGSLKTEVEPLRLEIFAGYVRETSSLTATFSRGALGEDESRTWSPQRFRLEHAVQTTKKRFAATFSARVFGEHNSRTFLPWSNTLGYVEHC